MPGTFPLHQTYPYARVGKFPRSSVNNKSSTTAFSAVREAFRGCFWMWEYLGRRNTSSSFTSAFLSALKLQVQILLQ